jgi:hypothetical protein
MSQWHRNNPELAGHPAYDPWMQHESYRKVAPMSGVEREALKNEAEYIRELERKAREDA